MAIVKMKKLKVIAMAEDRQEMFDELLKMGCVEVSDPGDKLSDPAWSALLQPERVTTATATRNQINSAKTALEAIKKYGSLKNGMFVKRVPVSEAEFLDDANAEKAKAACDKIGELLDRLNKLGTEKGRLESRKAGLLPWSNMDLALENGGSEHAVFKIGVCPGATDTSAIQKDLEASGAAAELVEISADKQQKYLLLVTHKDDEQAAMDVLHNYVFSVVSFPGEKGVPADIIKDIDAKLAENEKEAAETEAAIASCDEYRDAIRMYSDRLAAEASEEAGAERTLTDGTISFFEGWCPAESLDKVGALLDKYGCAWEASDPTDEDIPDVPVRLKNNRFTSALNMVTEMYSLPSYANVDPNPLMAIFFIVFYGIMMADMGYGLLMFIAGLLITKKYAPKGTGGNMFNLMIWGGISTFIMGVLTGGFFGDFIPKLVEMINPAAVASLPKLLTDPPIKPLDDTIRILIGAMALGIVHLVTGMVISVVIKARRKEYMSILWNEVTWWIVLAGLALMLLGVTNIVLIIGGIMVVVGSGWEEKNIFKKLLAVLVSLYNNVTGWLGDILSYSRLMALMLAGSVIAQVFNTLGQLPGNVIAFLIISLVGNALNFALNLLGCYVHDLRLQCLEFFNKFYEDGGKPFRPMEINTKYVDIQ